MCPASALDLLVDAADAVKERRERLVAILLVKRPKGKPLAIRRKIGALVR